MLVNRIRFRTPEPKPASVPLFNIRAAAAGVEHGWRRSESSLEAESLLAANLAALVVRYRNSSDHNVRAGYLDALRYADLSTLTAWRWHDPIVEVASGHLRVPIAPGIK